MIYSKNLELSTTVAATYGWHGLQLIRGTLSHSPTVDNYDFLPDLARGLLKRLGAREIPAQTQQVTSTSIVRRLPELVQNLAIYYANSLKSTVPFEFEWYLGNQNLGLTIVGR